MGSVKMFIQWARCGASAWSAVPTLMWATGAVVVTRQLLQGIFRRFLFRRQPLWEIILQQLLFTWIVVYSLHFWALLVKLIKLLVDFCIYDQTLRLLLGSDESLSGGGGAELVKQAVIWVLGAVPLGWCVYSQHRRHRPPPLMLWITTSPWRGREMGAYGYYLLRPLPPAPAAVPEQALRKAASDSRLLEKEPRRKRRQSKSV